MIIKKDGKLYLVDKQIKKGQAKKLIAKLRIDKRHAERGLRIVDEQRGHFVSKIADIDASIALLDEATDNNNK